MNAQDMYDSELQFSEDDFSPKSNMALSHHDTLSTSYRQLLLSTSICDVPQSQSGLFGSTQLSNCSLPDNHGSSFEPSMRGPAFNPWHHKVTSKLKQENSVSSYSLASLPSCSNVGPLKQIQNVMNRSVDSSPLKKKCKMMLPYQKLAFSSQDFISDDFDTSPHDSGHFESSKKTTTATGSLSPAQAEGQRPLKGCSSLILDEDDAVVMTELMNEVTHEDQEFLPSPIHVDKLCSPPKTLSCLSVKHHPFSQVHKPMAGKENVYPLKRSHSEWGARTVESKLGELDASSSFSDPKVLETHITVMKALSRSFENEENLTGDFSKALLLPVLEIRKHSDLWSISVHTLADVIKGKYNGKLASCRIIDCRYPYEYDGGHIKGAEMWHLPELVSEHLKAKKNAPFIASEEELRHIMVFHCEFSTERGPKAQRLLRQIDRTANKKNYPALHFPEVYLLEGGYNAFFKKYSELCTPCNYVRMVDPKHNEDLKHFKAKSKSWDSGKEYSKICIRFPRLELS
ncbi:M-phase inducer phosphatase 3-like [Portunus trituberculatus]|uniref:M-phase inducer phosphatase 3-like n=1 Tax=Portunus trituberculatus TaxID=210409 RepID=UPI001E1CBA36|nr:M-phase inducer phosphatase 3-like [Portunus trituberculatus]